MKSNVKVYRVHEDRKTVNETNTEAVKGFLVECKEEKTFRIYPALGKAINHNVILNRAKILFITCFSLFFFIFSVFRFFLLRRQKTFVLKFVIVNSISLNEYFLFSGGNKKTSE